MKSIKKNLDELAALLKLPDFNSVMELNYDRMSEAGAYAYSEALHEGSSEKKAEKARETAEAVSQDEVYGNWHTAVMAAVDSLFEKHALMVVPRRAKEKFPYDHEVLPARGKTWEDAAREIVKTIDGVGMVAVAPDDLKPPQTFVAKHLHWIEMYPEVYGTSDADRIYNSNWRD